MDFSLIKYSDVDEYLPDLRKNILSFFAEASQSWIQHKYTIIEFTSTAAEYCLTIIDPNHRPSSVMYKSALGLLVGLLSSFPEPIFKKIQKKSNNAF